MIAYLDNDKKDIVFAQIIGDRNKIRERINNSKYGDVVDKFCLRKYLSEAMILNYNGFNEVMFCNPNDIMEKVDIDSTMLEMIFSDEDYDKFIENASKYSSRLLMLYKEVIPFVEFKEIEKFTYDKACNYKEETIELINMNTEILKLMKIRNDIKYNFGKENVENILNKDDNFDDYVYRPMEVNNAKVKELKLTRENAKKGAETIID